MRRLLPWLFLAAAVFGLIATLTAHRVNWWWAAEKGTRVMIALGYLFPHHRWH